MIRRVMKKSRTIFVFIFEEVEYECTCPKRTKHSSCDSYCQHINKGCKHNSCKRFKRYYEIDKYGLI